MGAWGEGPFDNDTAADWVDEFEDSDREAGLQRIQAAFLVAAESGSDDYLEADPGVEAVAAAELVAAIRGLPVERSAYNETALDWIERTQASADDALVALAVRALERVIGPNSELAQLWDEAGSPSWRSSVEARKSSLTA